MNDPVLWPPGTPPNGMDAPPSSTTSVTSKYTYMLYIKYI